jgi:hypothetical protein
MANIQIHLPVARAEGRDRYPRVELTLNGSPVRYVFWFAYVEERGEERLVCAETAIQQAFDDPTDQEIATVAPPIVRDFLNRWETLERTARAALGGVDPDHAGVARAPRTRRELTTEFLAEVVRRHGEYRAQGVAPTEALAREEHVGPSTVRHWLRKAREAGIDES